MRVLTKSGFVERIGKENVNPNLNAAIARTNEILKASEADESS
jgi:hypothetical protein